MGFFWKFTRSGRYSTTYVSLIVDVDPFSVDRGARQWHTSFLELGMFMLLLHDVELHNQPQLGATKPAFRAVVRMLGYEPTLEYTKQRERMGLVIGKSVMGTHGGGGLDWGRYSSGADPINLSLDGLDVGCYVSAIDGHLYGTEDKLQCYRRHPDFCQDGDFFDLMPKHIVMKSVVESMKKCDGRRTERFISDFLKWRKQ